MTANGNTKLKPINSHMKIGLFAGVFFLLISQVIMIFIVPTNPSNVGLIIDIGMMSNLLVFPAVLVLIYGVLKRRLQKPFENTDS